MKLVDAIEANNPDEVSKALKRVKNINRQLRDNGYTPLGYACQLNADKVVAVLLEAGASPEPDEPLHPLYQAATEGSTAALAVLLEAREWEPEPVVDALRGGAIQGQTEALRLLMDKTGALPLPLALCAAAMTGRLDTVRLLLERGSDPNALHDGRAGVHTAARAGYPSVLEAMLRHGADVNLPDADGRTPLMHATLEHLGQRYQRVKVWQDKRDIANPDSGVKLLSGSLAEPPRARQTIEVLLAAGAAPTATDRQGNSGLDLLVQDGRRVDPWLQARLESVGARRGDDWPVRLSKAISEKKLDSIRELLAAGRNLDFTTPRHFSMLTLACRIAEPEIVRMLLAAGADPNFPGAHETPLAAAVVGANLEVVQTMLDAGARPASEALEDGYNELQLARSLGYREIARLLADRGAELPTPTQSRVEPGVHWWEDWEYVVVKADVPTVVGALDPTGDSIDLQALGKTFTSAGRGTMIVVQPKGLAWSNVFRASPVWRNTEDDFKQVAQRLAIACQTQAVHAAYSDCAGAASIVRYEADGATSIDDGGADLDYAEMAVSCAEEQGKDPPEWATEMIRLAEETGEDPPDSSERLETLAKEEGFALGWAYPAVASGEEFDVAFDDYPPEAFESVAVVEDRAQRA